ncbi:MAG: BamA/TamA family outer membrane protein [Flavobacterium sp.]
MRKILAKISLFILIGIIYSACNSVKRVPENRHLLEKVEIFIDGKKTNDEAIEQLLYQNSNTRIAGNRLSLHIYNLAKPKHDSLYKAQFINNPKKYHRQVRLLSAKQVKRKGESFLYSGIHNFFKKIGEEPVLIDKKKTEKSVINFKSYFFNLGYYKAEAKYTIDTLDKKKAKIRYFVTKGPVSLLDSIKLNIKSPELDTLYKATQKRSLIKKGNPYRSEDFIDERDRLTTYFRNRGIYYFQQNDITFDIDTVKTGGKSNVKININDYNFGKGDSIQTKHFEKYNISEVNIFTESNNSKDKSSSIDSVSYNNFNLYSSTKLRYKPKAITNAIFISKGSLYSDENVNLTKRYLSNLKIFNYPIIEFKEDTRDTTKNNLISNIYLKPLDKRHFSTALDLTHSNIQDFGIVGTASILARNVFKGAETFEISGRGNIGSSKSSANPLNKFFNVSEYGVDTRLNFPRVLFPVETDKIIPKSMIPTTSVNFGYSKQINLGLDKTSLTSAFRYNWKPKQSINTRFDLLNIQYINNLNTSNYYNVYKSSYDELNAIAQNPSYNVNPSYFDSEHNLIVESGTTGFTNDVLSPNSTVGTSQEDYDEVKSLEEKRIRLVENNLIFSTSFGIEKTTQRNPQDNSFYTVRAKFESAGNFMSLVAQASQKLNTQEKNNTIFGVIYSQYFKTDLEYIKHWDLSHKKILAVRSFLGIAIPYGNSDNIPFSRSYFAGGSNDIRAWQPYSLGPGSSGSINDFNEANLKITLNAEFRFNIVRAFHGALFVDSGNIWNIWDNVTDKKFIFSGPESLKNMAVGTGAGLRYDFDFFVVRVDYGVKTYNPALPEGQKWFSNLNNNDSVLNFGINYPF